MDTPRKPMSCYDFGRRLIETNDLDPVYVVLWHSGLDEGGRPNALCRWLLAYWCFYHAGTASWILDAPEVIPTSLNQYWSRMWEAAGSKAYPRGHERRHFRGENARNSIGFLYNQGINNLFSPLIVGPGVVDSKTGNRPVRSFRVSDVMSYVQTWTGFGPWIAFKVADMLERLNLSPVQFDDAAMFLFDSPREGARMLWDTEHTRPPTPGEAEREAVDLILNELGSIPAPPRYERPINAQEAETVLCKWKSYMKGHYRLGEDIESLRAGLLRYGKTPTAQRLLVAGKEGGLW